MTIHCDPNLIELSFIKLWFFTAAVLIETLSAPASSKFLISSTLEIPPPTVKGTKQLFAVALDVRNNLLAMKGWVKQTKIKLMHFSKKLEDFGVTRIIYTDINRDGTKQGVNFPQLKKIISKTNIPLVVSGGVSNIKDIQQLNKFDLFDGVIIGKAIYDKSISFTELRKFV